jgi:hypothetical protein
MMNFGETCFFIATDTSVSLVKAENIRWTHRLQTSIDTSAGSELVPACKAGKTKRPNDA